MDVRELNDISKLPTIEKHFRKDISWMRLYVNMHVPTIENRTHIYAQILGDVLGDRPEWGDEVP